MLAACLQVSAKGFSQTITLTGKDLSLEKVFKEVKRQSGYLFVYRDEWLKQAKNVDISISGGTVAQVLDYCFKGQPLTYSIVDKTVVVRLKNEEKKADSTPVIKLTGNVTDKSTGKPLEGASVYVKNSQTGTSTNSEGLFALGVNRTGFVLVVAYTGYKTLELPFDGRTELNIELEPSTSELDNVVMIAYGQTTKRFNTGNVSKVTSEDIARQPVTNPLEALEGRVPGVFITQTNGLPGGPVTVQIRGQNSIAASNNPLYIVDGMPFTSTPVEIFGGPNAFNSSKGDFIAGSPLNSISPSDIESIEILKDADATAIYGSRGANGVVLITTKKGQTGKTTLDLNIKKGIGKISHFAPTLNTEQYLQMRRDAFVYDGITPSVSNAPDLLTWDTTKYTDWQKYFLGGTNDITEATATLSGGNSNTRFSLSGTLNHQTTIYPTDDGYTRTNIHMNVEHNSQNQKFYMSLSALYSHDKNKLSGFQGELQNAAILPPNYPGYDSTGKLYWGGGRDNPLADLLVTYKSHTDNLNGDLLLRYNLLPGLSIKSNLGYNKIEISQISSTPSFAINPLYNAKGYSQFGNQYITSYVFEPQINFKHKIANGNLDFLLGTTLQQTITDGTSQIVNNYSSDLLLESRSAGTVGYTSYKNIEYKYASIFSRINYNWQNKYIANINFRRDGSSKFGPNYQFGNFASYGFAWIFSSERFIKNNFKWWSYGKIRGSYGTTGNDGIADYGYLATYQSGNLPYGSTPVLQPSKIANPDYRWEVNKKFELSADLGFINDRILLSTSYFLNRSDNELVGLPLPSITGFGSYQANLPARVENKGWEVEVNTTNIDKKNITWKSSFNISILKNKLASFPSLETSSYANTYVVGQPLSIIQGYQFTGVNQESGVAEMSDINHDDILTPLSSYNNQGGDYIIIGKTTPDFYGGFNNTVSYKNFRIDIFFQFVKQQGYNLNGFYYYSGKLYNAWTTYLNYWKPDHLQTTIPTPTTNYGDAFTANINYHSSNAAISDASFIRLKNVMLSYIFTTKWLNTIGIKTGRVYIQAQNLLTITNFKGYDPENASTTIYLPPLRIITAGVQCSF